ncbi:arsenate reductase [Aurantiacibacter aquimixticola]|uniref:Arsenate reductase n=1 Tax=Aurantiacibacter aquimixticola TaxID=1958945 RepID=A0A419RU62_9SPHN|nr:arsenate reductase [Aurantiacibacter aquimixticola]RJY09333.1 arsenate reductase [Aurantiacibacter aquimixticola]
MTIHLYGIPNCESVRKARKWLDGRGLGYTFHDFKKEGVEPDTLSHWADRCGWEVLLNRRGTTWRKLEDAQKEDVDREKALALMEEHTSLIKRPVMEREGDSHVLVGFTQSEWENALC